ncbi:MAG: lysozyme-like domain-containing protein [Piptocephalis tieghemiana]|nr:MAG: lysozyme-like domain-containing protein [Piptocephalis tieghemiana]
MRFVHSSSLIVSSLLLAQAAYGSNILRPRNYAQNDKESCEQKDFSCKDDTTFVRCVYGELVPFQCAPGTKCSDGACRADDANAKYGGGDDPSNTSGGYSGEDDPSNTSGGYGGENDPSNTSGGYGGENDPSETGGEYGEADASDPSGGYGGEEEGEESDEDDGDCEEDDGEDDDSEDDEDEDADEEGGYSPPSSTAGDGYDSKSEDATSDSQESTSYEATSEPTGSTSDEGGYESGEGQGGGGDLMCQANDFFKGIEDAGFSKPTVKQFQDFSTTVLKESGITSKRELAMFLAQILHESGGLQFKEEIACKDTGCPGEYGNSGSDPNKMYFGRGYMQLTWKDNYEACSKALFGDDRLVKDPTLVAKDDKISWGVSAWYWKAKVHKDALTGKFGLTTKDINGDIECSGGENANALKRFKIYESLYKAFGLPGKPDPSGCY